MIFDVIKSRRLRIGGTLLKDWRFVIILILILGIIFRAFNLNSPFEGRASLNEVHYSMEARNFEKYGPFVLWPDEQLKPCFDHPPLFQWIVYSSFKFLGESEVTARLVPITFGISTLVFMFLLGSILVSKGFGLLMAFMLAINPMHAYYSQNVQLEAPMLFFMVASLYFFILWMRSGKTRYLWLAGAMNTLGLFTKQTFIIVLLPIFFFLIRKKGWLSSLRDHKVWLFLSLPLIPSISWSLYGLNMIGRQAARFVTFLGISLMFQSKFYSQEYNLLISGWGPIYFTLFLLGFASSLFFKDLKDQVMLLWLLGGTGYILFYARASYIHEYYLLTIIIPATFFAVKPLEALHAKKKYSCLLLAILIILSSAYITRNLHVTDREPGFKEAGLYLNARTKPDEMIVCSSPQVIYYAQRKVLLWVEIQNITHFENILQRENIRYAVDIPGAAQFLQRKPELLAYLEENFTLEAEFGGVKIYSKE